MTALATSGFDRAVSLTLHRDLKTGIWHVDQFDTRYGPVRNTTRFIRPTPIDTAFSASFLTCLSGLLPSSPGKQFSVVPGLAMKTPTFAAEDLRILAQAGRNGVQVVMILCKRVIGRVFDMLAPEYRPEVWPDEAGLTGQHPGSNSDLSEQNTEDARLSELDVSKSYVN